MNGAFSPSLSTREIMLHLREDTRVLHAATEQNPYMQHLIGGSLTRAHLVAATAQLHHLHQGLEGFLLGYRYKGGTGAEVLRDHHFLVSALARRDLEHWREVPEAHAINHGVRAFLAEAEKWFELDPAGLLGLLYVMEGSLNGAKMLARRYKDIFGLEAGQPGLLHLDPHGSAQRQRWNEFSTTMNAAGFTPDERRHILAGARVAFLTVGSMYEEICAGPAMRGAGG